MKECHTYLLAGPYKASKTIRVPIEAEHSSNFNFYYPKKPDNKLFTNAGRVFKATGNRRRVLGVYVNVPPSRLLQGGENYAIDVDGVAFHTNSLIHAGETSARGTAIFEAVPAPPENPTTVQLTSVDVPPRVVVKMTWHTPGTHYEGQLLRLAAERGVAGFARLYRSAVGPRVSEGFRGRLVPDVMYANRELRIQVIGPLARPLHETSDLKTFKAAFKSFIKSAFRFICD